MKAAKMQAPEKRGRAKSAQASDFATIRFREAPSSAASPNDIHRGRRLNAARGGKGLQWRPDWLRTRVQLRERLTDAGWLLQLRCTIAICHNRSIADTSTRC